MQRCAHCGNINPEEIKTKAVKPRIGRPHYRVQYTCKKCGWVWFEGYVEIKKERRK